MAAYLIGQISVKDDVLWQQYVDGVKISLESFDATIVFRGEKQSVLSGANNSSLVVVVKFIDMKELNNWFNSHKYQSIIEIRDKAADVTITTYED